MKDLIRNLFAVRYRLTHYRRGKPHSDHYPGGRHYRAMIASRIASLREDGDVSCWTLYKTGPLRLPERETLSGQQSPKQTP